MLHSDGILFLVEDETFLYVHQTAWQKQLLCKYGQEQSLLDATYGLSPFTLSLSFLVVPTNVCYVTVATFIT